MEKVSETIVILQIIVSDPILTRMYRSTYYDFVGFFIIPFYTSIFLFFFLLRRMIKFYLESLEDFLSKSSRTSYIRYIVIIIQFSTSRLLLYESMENKELEGSRKQRFTSWR